MSGGEERGRQVSGVGQAQTKESLRRMATQGYGRECLDELAARRRWPRVRCMSECVQVCLLVSSVQAKRCWKMLVGSVTCDCASVIAPVVFASAAGPNSLHATNSISTLQYDIALLYSDTKNRTKRHVYRIIQSCSSWSMKRSGRFPTILPLRDSCDAFYQVSMVQEVANR
jgi:hypothetical protein